MNTPFNALAAAVAVQPKAATPAKPVAKPKPAVGPNPGLRQIDGNISALGLKPTKGSLQDRSASPSGGDRSGMETAMGAMADKLHPPKFKGRR